MQWRAYACEAALIGDDRIPALHESVEQLRCASLLWLAGFVDEHLVKAVAWLENEHEVNIDRVVVEPDMHRNGIGATLVREIQQRAHGRRVVVATGRGNFPTERMYLRLGFRKHDDVEVIPGLWTSRFSW